MARAWKGEVASLVGSLGSRTRGQLLQRSAPLALCSQRDQVLAREPQGCRPCTFKSAWRGASAHPGLGSRVASLALLAASG